MIPEQLSGPEGKRRPSVVASTAKAAHAQGLRRVWFRAFALAMPLVVLALLEAALRLAGYGYPTSFFLSLKRNNVPMLIENPKFGWSFFPHSIARSPQPLLFPAQKPFGTIRIFLFGESAAMGDPEPAFGFGRQLQKLLQARHPGQRIEVINVAMTAINSHVIRAIARDCARRQGDVWLVYAGNNEVIGPFGAGTVFGSKAPGLPSVRAILAAKKFRVGQLLSGLGRSGDEPHDWEGMELFLHNQVTARDRRLDTVYNNFSANLAAIIGLGNNSGARVVLSTIAVNLKDNPPFASAHRPNLSSADLKAWEEQFEIGRKAESEQLYAEALAAYQKAAQLDAEFAELIFRRARCELRLGQAGPAETDFSLARDLDALRFRADSRLNEIIRKAGERGVAFVDLERELNRAASSGVSGEEWFYDHVHLNFSGNYQAARLLAGQVEKDLFPSANLSGSWLPESEVAHQLAFTDFDRRHIGEEMQRRLQQAPFSAQSNFQERDERWRQMLTAPHGALTDLQWEYRAALALSPEDWMLRENFGRLLESIGDRKGAIEQWGQVAEELPEEPEGYFHLGNLAFEGGALGQARGDFRRALKLRPGAVEALSGLGLVLAAQGQTNDALAQFDSALKLDPRFSAARVNRAVVLANCGDLAGAISEYQTVLKWETNSVAARINLAKLYFNQGKASEAIALYTKALELKPDNAIAQFDLGNALSAQGRHEEALAHYASAVACDPGFVDAQYNLAVEQARFGKISEAVTHFAEAVRLRPGAADLHFNYGVALAKMQRFNDAAHEFEETLKLQPNHPSAQSMLTRARQLGSGPLLP